MNSTVNSFAALMAISATQTRETQQLVQHKLEERNRRLAEQKKLQEEKDAREREQEKKLRMKRFEEEKRQKEREQRMEAERKAREATLAKREEEQRDALRYGPKKAAKLSAAAAASGAGKQWPTSTSGSKEPQRKYRFAEDEDEPAGIVLTREELRERKQQSEMRKVFSTSKRPSQSAPSYRKHGTRLPGGAMNIVKSVDDPSPLDNSSGRSVKDRLIAQPNMLTLLNTKKKDKRTEDEILMEVRAKRKMLSGTDALLFDDWFGDKKKEAPKKASTPVSSSSTPPATVLEPPVPRAKTQPPAASGSFTASSMHRNGTSAPRPASTKPNPSAVPKSLVSNSRASSADMLSSASSQQNKYFKNNKAAPPSSAAHRNQRPSAATSASNNDRGYSRSKRPRSPSLSESPPPQKKRALKEDISSTIWGLFGKDRQKYTSQDVYSDDEDMEADANALEREEKFSARVARKEEMLAQEEERLHEEEKRQRKRERERAMARDR